MKLLKIVALSLSLFVYGQLFCISNNAEATDVYVCGGKLDATYILDETIYVESDDTFSVNVKGFFPNGKYGGEDDLLYDIDKLTYTINDDGSWTYKNKLYVRGPLWPVKPGTVVHAVLQKCLEYFQ